MSNLSPEQMTARSPTPLPDLVWRATISGLLKELTGEVLALTEVVLAMNEKLAAIEASNTGSRPDET